MSDIKFEYGFENHEPVRYTIEQIEAGLDFSKTGKPVYRRQYTGLKDRNGVEIYEGDIVKCSKRREDGLFIVKRSEGSACFVFDNEGSLMPLQADDFSYVEGTSLIVVGNIYENQGIEQ